MCHVGVGWGVSCRDGVGVSCRVGVGDVCHVGVGWVCHVGVGWGVSCVTPPLYNPHHPYITHPTPA